MNSNDTNLPKRLTRNLVAALTFLLAAAYAPLPSQAAPVLLNRIVAVVNSAVITQSELDQQLQQTLNQMALRKTPPPAKDVLEKRILERMITERVLLQMADESNIRIDGDTLDRAVARVAAQNNLDLPAFRAALEKDGISFEAFRKQIRQQLIISRLREREVDNHIVVTDAEIDNFLANQKQDAEHQTEYNLSHILFLAPEGASPDALQKLKAKAEKAAAELKAGADFAQVSASYSDAQNALQGGAMGWRSEAKLPSLFVDAVKDLKAGDITPVLHSANGYHILKLIDKRGVDTKMIVHQTHARHILIKTNEVITEQDAYVRLMELRDRLINGSADFAKLAKQYSNDASAPQGGDLGWLNPGDTVPEFERTMDATAVGEISKPVKSPFGLHLIQVLERRDHDVGPERQRLLARQSIRERKSEEAFDDWVRQSRDRAYVEYRLGE
jgi:peptidyl-prolyl cis-trans isomerase SurA